MSSSEESTSTDGTDDDGTVEGWDYPDTDDEDTLDFGDFFDFDDEERFSVLIDTLLESIEPGAPQAPVATNAADYLIRSAMRNASAAAANANGASVEFGDFIRSYLFTPALQSSSVSASSSSHYYLSSNPSNEAERDDLKSAKLFVGNLPRGTDWRQLSDFFDGKGYLVKRADINNKNVRTNPSKPL